MTGDSACCGWTSARWPRRWTWRGPSTIWPFASHRQTTAATLLQVDRLLTPYGGLGATPRALQLSHWFVDNELLQLQTFGVLLPSIFLLVGAFTLNVALTRALALQRTQIAALKALGYSNLAIGWHYMKWALLIAGVGLLIGVGAGAWLGRALGGIYNDVFRFPDLRFRVPLRVVAGATALTSGAAAAGAWSAVRRAVRVPPAEAMRPEGPARYRQRGFERTFESRMATTSRMVLRHILRRPLRAVTSVVGIGLAVAVLMVGLVFSNVIDRIVIMQFSRIERQDVDRHLRRAAHDDVVQRTGAPAGRPVGRTGTHGRRPAFAPVITNAPSP